MTTNIEHRVQALQGFPLNDEITQDQNQYSLWFLANFGESIADNSFTENRECQYHLDSISRLGDAPYRDTLDSIRGTYISLLHAKAERLGDIVQESLTGQFISYASGSKSYLEKLTEAVDDHFGKMPEQITKDDIECMQHVYLNLQEAHGYVRDYGYQLNEKRLPTE